jgi:hypothetical protein
MVSNAVFQTPGPAALESPRQAQVVTAAVVVPPDLGGGGDPDDGGESQTEPDDGAELVPLWFGDVDM